MSVGEVECGCHFLSFSSGSSTRPEIALRVSALVHARGNSPASVNDLLSRRCASRWHRAAIYKIRKRRLRHNRRLFRQHSDERPQIQSSIARIRSQPLVQEIVASTCDICHTHGGGRSATRARPRACSLPCGPPSGSAGLFSRSRPNCLGAVCIGVILSYQVDLIRE